MLQTMPLEKLKPGSKLGKGPEGIAHAVRKTTSGALSQDASYAIGDAETLRLTDQQQANNAHAAQKVNSQTTWGTEACKRPENVAHAM